MIAVIELKGKQFRVAERQVIRTLKIEGDPGAKVQADRVLATFDGDTINIGTPVVSGGMVELEIIRQSKSPKIDVFKYQPKKRVSRRYGYRDEITYLRVTRVGG
jgi:large subunit ribosomal protein L21